MCSQCEHGHAGTLRVIQTIDQVKVPRPGSPGGYRKFAGHCGFSRGRKGSCFLMPDVHPLNTGTLQGVSETIKRVPGDTPDALNTVCLKRSEERRVGKDSATRDAAGEK